jgi:hypothetical protein
MEDFRGARHNFFDAPPDGMIGTSRPEKMRRL